MPARARALVVGTTSTVDADSPALGAGVAAAVFVVLALLRHWRGPGARGRRSPVGPSPVGGPPPS